MSNKDAYDSLLAIVNGDSAARGRDEGAGDVLRRLVNELLSQAAGERDVTLKVESSGAGRPPDQVATQLTALTSVTRSQTRAAEGTTKTTERKTEGGYFSALFGNWESSMPLIAGLARLFGGKGEEPPPALPRYAWPTALRFEAGVADPASGALSDVDYTQEGQPRPAARGPVSYGGQITVNVQAMDSRSFLDHRDEIARAVREAMLDSHPLNDVVAEL